MHLKLTFVAVSFLVVSFVNLANSAPSTFSGIRGDSKKIDRELAKFRHMVEKYLPKEAHWSQYGSNSDRFLLRFLSAWEFNRVEAKSSLKQYFAWREAENIDLVLDSNFLDLEERYPYRVSYFDFYQIFPDSKMTLYVNSSHWNLTEVEASSKEEQQRFVRYVSIKMMEDANHQTLQHDSLFPELKDPSQFRIVLNLNGCEWGMIAQHNRVQLEIIQTLVTHWREAIDGIHLVNAPEFHEGDYELIEDFKTRSGIDVLFRYSDRIMICTESFYTPAMPS